jgi:hypothetical protein
MAYKDLNDSYDLIVAKILAINPLAVLPVKPLYADNNDIYTVLGILFSLPSSTEIPTYEPTFVSGNLYSITLPTFTSLDSFPDLFYIKLADSIGTSQYSSIGLQVAGVTTFIISISREQNGSLEYIQQLEPGIKWLCSRGNGRAYLLNNGKLNHNSSDFDLVNGTIYAKNLKESSFWQEQALQNGNLCFLTAGSLTSGTIASSSFQGWSNGVVLKTAIGTNSGYRLATEQTIQIGVKSKKIKINFKLENATTKLVLGFFNTNSTASSTNAIKYEIVAGVGTFSTITGGNTSTHVTTFAHNTTDVYTITIEVNALGTQALCKLYVNDADTSTLDRAITTNIPTGVGNLMLAGLKAWYNGTSASVQDLVSIGTVGLGDIEGFNKIKGTLN